MRKKKTNVDIQKLLRQYEKQKQRTKKYLQSVEKKTLILCKKDKFKEIAKFIAKKSSVEDLYDTDENIKKEIDEITKLLLSIAVAEKRLENHIDIENMRNFVNEIKSKL